MVNGVFTIPLPGQSLDLSVDLLAEAERGPTLSEFVAGPENRLAGVALSSVLDQASTTYSPLVLYGPSGSGKSHLARGLANWWQHHRPAELMHCLTGAEFAQEYANAVEHDQLPAWREQYRAVALLVLEDLGSLGGKRAAQQELCRWIDNVTNREGVIVVTSRTLPNQLPTLSAALRSRLSAGLAVPLAPPGTAARRAIVERFAALRGMALPKRAMQLLADELQMPVPVLFGALMELEMIARVDGRPIDAERVGQYVAGRGQTIALSLRSIAVQVARYFGLTLADLKSPLRRQALVAARGVVIYLARQLTDKSLEQIGAYLGGRDHTTVLHAYRRTERLVKRDPSTKQTVAEIKRMLLTT